jgi:hypothetical protein
MQQRPVTQDHQSNKKVQYHVGGNKYTSIPNIIGKNARGGGVKEKGRLC